jgi:sugar lactone lactonase YvrE
VTLRTETRAPVHTVATGLVLPESPRWHGGRLWFADWGAQELIATNPEGMREVVARVPSFPFSFDWLPDGQLLIVSARERLLLAQNADGRLLRYADLGGLSERPWNEIVVDGRGNAYVNNIGFDFPAGEFAPGIVAVVTPAGVVRQVADGLSFPNGMAVTPDNSTLIVAESYGRKLTAFDIDEDGTLLHKRTWADLAGGVPDGICLDADLAVWYGDVPNKRCVRVREGGQVLQTINFERGCFACMLGGDAGTTLFVMTAEWRGAANMHDATRTGEVLSVQVPVPHAGRP